MSLVLERTDVDAMIASYIFGSVALSCYRTVEEQTDHKQSRRGKHVPVFVAWCWRTAVKAVVRA